MELLIRKLGQSRRFIAFLVLIVLLAFFLRIYRVQSVPPGLYVDEVAIGFNAYSILKTGRDEYGVLLPLFFKSFGDFKLPIYIYLTSLSEFFFGKNELAVRLPSVLAGVGGVLCFSLILRQLRESDKFSLLGAFFLAIAPWSLQFSRAAFEANLALFTLLLGLLLIIAGFKKRVFLFAGLLFFIISLYTYHTERIFVPLFCTAIIFLYWKNLKKLFFSKSFLISLFFLALLSLPFLFFAFSKEGLVRASSESFINEVKIRPDDFFQNMAFLRINQFFKNYLSYFSLDFLFFTGDGMGRHGVGELGLMHLWQLPFLFFGLLVALKRRKKSDLLFLSWFFIAPIAAASARPSPHALRSLPSVVPLVFFITLGILTSFQYVKKVKLPFLLILSSVASYFLFLYLHVYYVHYPKRTAPDWSNGYKEVIEYLNLNERKYKKILITNEFGNGYIYLLFYGQNGTKNYGQDKKKGFGKYSFINSPYTQKLDKDVLYVAPFWEKREEGLLNTFYNLSGSELFKLWEN